VRPASTTPTISPQRVALRGHRPHDPVSLTAQHRHRYARPHTHTHPGRQRARPRTRSVNDEKRRQAGGHHPPVQLAAVGAAGDPLLRSSPPRCSGSRLAASRSGRSRAMTSAAWSSSWSSASAADAHGRFGPQVVGLDRRRRQSAHGRRRGCPRIEACGGEMTARWRERPPFLDRPRHGSDAHSTCFHFGERDQRLAHLVGHRQRGERRRCAHRPSAA